jgi:hypothetical protein
VIATSAHPRGDHLQSVVFVARDRATALVHGTYTHSYFEGAESENHKAALDRWTAELRERVGPRFDLHITTHPAAALDAELSGHLHRPGEPGEPGDHRMSESSSISRP